MLSKHNQQTKQNQNKAEDKITLINPLKKIPQFLAIKMIRGYQLFISPMLGPRCRFYPTCSQYAVEALQTHGLIKGLWLTIKRLAKCHPFHAGGIDEVPPKS